MCITTADLNPTNHGSIELGTVQRSIIEIVFMVGAGNLEEEIWSRGKGQVLWVVANDTTALRNLEIEGMDLEDKIPGVHKPLETPLRHYTSRS